MREFRYGLQGLLSCFSGWASRRMTFAATALAFSIGLSFAVASLALVGATPAEAGCTQIGTVVTCTGDLAGPQNFNTSAGINQGCSTLSTERHGEY